MRADLLSQAQWPSFQCFTQQQPTSSCSLMHWLTLSHGLGGNTSLIEISTHNLQQGGIPGAHLGPGARGLRQVTEM